ncbi:LLM class flavin-dependent oxidoreductase [Streptomyces sp. NPDC029674]|uniref:LLM class flavin-dependent oxidoreductase n=1 Tax=Streptomyces sp. NPDC029674 TaxID=3365297 RepID=UPI00384FED8D
MAIDIGVFLPVLEAEGRGQAGEFAAAARRAEELGFESVWASGHLTGRVPMLDATVTLATAAAVTTRVKVGYGVLTVPVHPVAHLAQQLASLQFLSEGRLLVGADAGGGAWAQWRGGLADSPVWAAAGVPYEERDERTDRALEQLGSLLVAHPTEVGGAELTLKPRVNRPPFLIGGESDADLRRAVRYGNWFPNLASPAYLARTLPRLAALGAETGRGVRPVVSVAVPAALDADGARERRDPPAGNVLRRYGIDAERASAMAVDGTPERAAEKIVEFARSGADRIVLSFPGADWRTQYERAARAAELAWRVLPFRRTATAGNQTNCAGWARVTLDVEREPGTYAFVNPIGTEILDAGLAEALEEGVREGLAGEARTVRVHRAWVHEVDANERVFHRAGREAVAAALAAERAGARR